MTITELWVGLWIAVVIGVILLFALSKREGE